MSVSLINAQDIDRHESISASSQTRELGLPSYPINLRAVRSCFSFVIMPD